MATGASAAPGVSPPVQGNEAFNDYLDRALAYQPFRSAASPQANSGLASAIRAQSTWNTENPTGVYVMSHPIIKAMSAGIGKFQPKGQDAVTPPEHFSPPGEYPRGDYRSIPNVGSFGTPGNLPSEPGAGNGPGLFPGNFNPGNNDDNSDPNDNGGPQQGPEWQPDPEGFGGWTGGLPGGPVDSFGYNSPNGNAPSTVVPTFWGPGLGNDPVEAQAVPFGGGPSGSTDTGSGGGFTKEGGSGGGGGFTKEGGSGGVAGGGGGVPAMRDGIKIEELN